MGQPMNFDRWITRLPLLPAFLPAVLLALGLACGPTGPSLAQAPADQAARGPANIAILVDTSQSMIELYTERQSGKTMVEELVETLAAVTVQPGDSLLVMPFDFAVRDDPGEFLVLQDVTPGQAAEKVGEMGLGPRQGTNTVRTAALGRAAQALQEAFSTDGRFSGALIYIVTDIDNDVKPDGPDAAAYDHAQALQQAGALTKVGEIAEAELLLQVWQLSPTSGGVAPSTGDGSAADLNLRILQQLRTAVPELLDRLGPITTAAVAKDLERSLTFRAAGEWQRDGEAWVLPVVLRAPYEALVFQGRLALNGRAQLAGAAGDSAPQLTLAMDQDPLTLGPEQPEATGTLRLTGLPQPGLLQRQPLEVTVDAQPTAAGILTDAPAVLAQDNPATAARVSGALWVDHAEPAVTLAAALPAPPSIAPPRGAQIAWALVALALLSGIGWFVWQRMQPPPPPPPLAIYYRLSSGVREDRRLPGPDAQVQLASPPLQIRRLGPELRAEVRGLHEAKLLNPDGRTELPPVTLGEGEGARPGAVFVVQTADGRRVGVSMATQPAHLVNPPQPPTDEAPLLPDDALPADTQTAQDFGLDDEPETSGSGGLGSSGKDNDFGI